MQDERFKTGLFVLFLLTLCFSLYGNGDVTIASSSSDASSNDWKALFLAECKSASDFIFEVIEQGEINHEVQEFKEKFESLNKWISEKVAQAKASDDSLIKPVLYKKKTISLLADVQKKANKFIEELVSNLALDKNDEKRLKLSVLYELFDAVSKLHDAEQDTASAKELTQEEIQQVVKKVATTLFPALDLSINNVRLATEVLVIRSSEKKVIEKEAFGAPVVDPTGRLESSVGENSVAQAPVIANTGAVGTVEKTEERVKQESAPAVVESPTGSQAAKTEAAVVNSTEQAQVAAS